MSDRSGRTTPIGLYHYAYSYAASASALSKLKVKANHADAPVRFLYTHAIELYLKAFLLTQGLTVKRLGGREFGHNIDRLMEKSRELGLDVEHEHWSQRWLLNEAIRDRYIEAGYRQVLTEESLHGLCLQLHNQVGLPIYQADGIARAIPGLPSIGASGDTDS